MTMAEEREPFTPIGDIARWMMIMEGIGAMRPLEPGSLITHDMISDWIGEPYPMPRIRGEFLVPDYGPIDKVKETLFDGDKILLIPEPNVGWRVATDSEISVTAEVEHQRVVKGLTRSGQLARAVNPARVTPAEHLRMIELQRDVQEARRVLTAQARERAKHAKRWES